jgi:hypothetical protein
MGERNRSRVQGFLILSRSLWSFCPPVDIGYDYVHFNGHVLDEDLQKTREVRVNPMALRRER